MKPKASAVKSATPPETLLVVWIVRFSLAMTALRMKRVVPLVRLFAAMDFELVKKIAMTATRKKTTAAQIVK